MKVLFFGSDQIAVPSLGRLLSSAHTVVGVVGRPDRQKGRGRKRGSTPLVAHAKELEIPLFQPENLERATFLNALDGLNWNCAVVVAYGGIIPRWLIDYPPYGFVNLHPSLLPSLRGPAPVRCAILTGCDFTGVTTMCISERVDAGDIYLSATVPILEQDTAGTLSERLAVAGAELLVETLDRIESSGLRAVPQDDELASFAPMTCREDPRIDWSCSSAEIDRQVRAFNPEPGAYTFLDGRRLKVWEVLDTGSISEGPAGSASITAEELISVRTGGNDLAILSLQPEGRNRMSSAAFIKGLRLSPGASLQFGEGPA